MSASPRQKFYIIVVMILLQFCLCSGTRVVYVMYLLVETVSHYQSVRQTKPVRLHWMAFLVECTSQQPLYRCAIYTTYPVVVLGNILWKII
jgi:hypothetical protein